jgi:tRNA pseudouridine38-40 synthase
MHRYFLKLSYKGTNYHGWQVQENTSKTIQQVINDSLSMILNEKIETLGCGRTDTGVHAREFYAHFDSSKNDLHIDPKLWLYKFNIVLPHDIAIQQIIPVKPDANARFSALSRTYEYIINRKKNPFLIDRAYYIHGDLNLEIMKDTARELYKHNDFSCFSKSRTQVKTNLCKITKAEWKEENDLLVFTITADRFLRNMVRAIVGTMIEAGQGKMTSEDFKKVIEGKSRSDAGYSVPAAGLYLTHVEYSPAIFR